MGSKIPRPARRILRDIVECVNERGFVLDGGASKGHGRVFQGKGLLRVRVEKSPTNTWIVVYRFWESDVFHEIAVDSRECDPVAVATSVLNFLDPVQSVNEGLSELEKHIAVAAGSSHELVRYLAASSLLATPETLLLLAGDSSSVVRAAVAENVNTPSRVRVLAASAS